jgi:hypothetical protein
MVSQPEQPFSGAHATKGTQMINRPLTRRSDMELAFMLDETARWTIKGRLGDVIGEVASLRCAVERAVEVGSIGHRVVAFVRSSTSEIVVFSAQIKRLASEFTTPTDWPVAVYAMKA